VINGNTTVVTASTAAGLKYFNPFTDTPVEGVNWRKGANFGKPRNATTFVGTAQGDFQLPRTFLMSFGVKF
ncbi:MAG TPA: hypothetical protein VN605_12480, partial [Thermoanaerobaculia bacterium]|nr:hypothetical protein [Thermoanaerobaculia bacterium]